MLELCLLGSGGMLPLPDRRLTALLVRNNGKMVLIDCGEGTQVAVRLLGWGFKTIDAICFTHYHADHILGLVGLLLTIGNNGRTEPLTILGPPPLQQVITGLRVIAPELPFELVLQELSTEEGSTFRVGDLEISSAPAEHTLPCLAYSITLPRQGKFEIEKAKSNGVPMSLWSVLQKGETAEFEGIIYTPDSVLGEERKGLKICYCTDSRPTDNLIALAKGADLFVCEGMYGDVEKSEKAAEKKHMTFLEAAKMAKTAGVQELWLTHFSPAMTTPSDYLEAVQIEFQNTIIGEDLMVKTLKFAT